MFIEVQNKREGEREQKFTNNIVYVVSFPAHPLIKYIYVVVLYNMWIILNYHTVQ